MLSHFSAVGKGSPGSAERHFRVDRAGLQPSSISGKYVDGRLKIGAVVRVLHRGTVNDPRLAQLRANADSARESDEDFRNACRTKAWTLLCLNFTIRRILQPGVAPSSVFPQSSFL